MTAVVDVLGGVIVVVGFVTVVNVVAGLEVEVAGIGLAVAVTVTKVVTVLVVVETLVHAPPLLPFAVVEVLAVDLGVTVFVVVVGEDVDPEARSWATWLRKPVLATACDISHIMMPPKLENCLTYETIEVSEEPEAYPEPAAVELPGMPRKILTLGFLLTVLAHVSHTLKSKLFCVAAPGTKDWRPQ